jgi:ribonuclease HII
LSGQNSKNVSFNQCLDLWQAEIPFRKAETGFICGVDEAGRGPLCGPVVAAAVILPFRADIPGLNDSKKLSEKKRIELFRIITKNSIAWSVASASAQEIDDVNILNATISAMNRAIRSLPVSPALALIDGNQMRNSVIPFKCIVKGDSVSASIAAASVLAKVTRDRLMTLYSKMYPEYELERHKGYPTKLHCSLILEHGPVQIYRKTFLKNILPAE